jgi:transposase
MSGAGFLAYVEQVLVPTLTSGDIVNHGQPARPQGAAVRRAIEAAGAELRLLPPYSPDFISIENAFSKLKALLRKAAARTVTALELAIAEAIDTFTPTECANDFAAAG